MIELIRLEMVIVKTKLKGRIGLGNLSQMLLDMVQRCKVDRDYASKPHPRSTNDSESILLETVADSETAPQVEIKVECKPLETDSAYASGTHETSVNIQSSSGKALEAITEGTEYTLGGSAFVGLHSLNEEQKLRGLGLYTAATTYSASTAPSLPPPRDNAYVADLAAELFSTIKPFEAERDTLEHIFQILPGLLRAFALKLGHRAQSQIHRDVYYFVHKYRE